MHYMEYNLEIADKARCCYDQMFFICAQDPHERRVSSSSVVRPDDIPGAAAQTVHPRSGCVAHRES